MDLSKLTDAELDALEQGRYDLLSDTALDMIEQSAAPAEPKGQRVYSVQPGPWKAGIEGAAQRLQDPNRWKQIAGMDDFQGHGDVAPVAGTPPMAVPAASLGRAGQLVEKAMSYAPARVAASTGVGAATNPDNPGRGAGEGFLWGLGGEAVSKTIGALARPARVAKYAADPVKAQDAATVAVENADEALRARQTAEAEAALAGKEYRIDPRKFQGSVPEADDAIREAMLNKPYPDLPDELAIPAMRGEKIRTALEAPINYPKGGVMSVTPEIADKFARNKALADTIRAQRAQHGGQEATQLYDEWSQALNEAQNLERSARNAPVSALTRPGTDSAALRMRIDRKVGSNLQDLGEQLSVAEKLRNPQGLEGLLKGATGLVKEAAKGTYKEPISQGANVIDPLALYLSGKAKNRSEKK